MAGNTAILAVKVVSDTKGAQQGLKDTGDAADGMSRKVAAGAAIAAAALATLAVKSVQAASDAEQATGAVEAVYGQYADSVIKNSKRAADAVGLSGAAYNQLASVIGSQLKNAGTPMEQVADSTDRLISLGADLASTYGGSVADAGNAISSLMRGERDPIEQYGVAISAAAVEAQKAAMGLDGLTGAADQQATSQATLALLYQQTADAQGQFAAESDTLAGQQERLNAKWTDAQAALGEALLPVLTLAAEALGQLAGWASENQTAFQILIGIIAAAAAAIWVLNVAMYANPIGLIIAAVALLIGIIVLLVMNWDQVVAAFENGARQIGDFIGMIGDWFADVFRNIGNWWDDLIASFGHGFDQLFGWVQDALGWLGDLIGASGNAADAANRVPRVAAPEPMVSAFADSPGLSSGGVPVRNTRATDPAEPAVNITVQGALDPDAVAQQVYRLLKRYDKRIGITAAAGVR